MWLNFNKCTLKYIAIGTVGISSTAVFHTRPHFLKPLSKVPEGKTDK